ncbi:complement factor H-like isoform X1 [Cheilinus undulatus]|uniref:complement factor H-like isoform X1 n=1 Tax=Cheilinus undulatus TaxID=241271 RepID=UPI001BD37A32|nr:complement factor H-like isoform X1 [Cheilinus undulatus]
MRLTLILLFLQLWGNVEFSLSQNVCSKLPDVPHAFISEDTQKEEYQPGNVIHFTCDIGYVSGPTIRYVCTDQGWHVLFQGACNLKPCELPDDTPNGYYEIIKGEDFVFGATIKYFCNQGYQMVSKDDTRTCLLDRWTNHVPICDPLNCEPPPEDRRITVNGLSGNQDPILPDRFLTFSCEEPGTYLNGSSRLICGHNGEWDHAFPTCEDITCALGEVHPRLTVTGLPAANETMKVGHQLRFRCDDQYTLEGPEVVECLQSGQWSKAFPTCSDKCKVTGVSPTTVASLQNNYKARQGQIIQFRCLNTWSGHVLHGNATIKCLAGGEWSDSFPTCGPPAGCKRPPHLTNGDTVGSSRSQYQHNERVQYTCQNLYIMEGTGYKTCNNGQWKGEIRCLKPCTVNSETMSRHNIRFRYGHEEKLYAPHNGGLTFKCIEGTRPVHPARMRRFCVDGVMDLPTCL